MFQFAAEWLYLTAASAPMTIPVLIVFLWAQRFLVVGPTADGVKC